MKKITISSEVTVYDSVDELNPQERDLLERASEQADQAYAPYSRFRVGAALLLENGEIVTGSNQENAAYPSGLCAERVAIFYSGSRFPGVPVRTIAIRSKSDSTPLKKPVAPCGACRQAIAEYEYKQGGDIRILLANGAGEIYAIDRLADILPFGFAPDDLNL